MPRHTLSSPVLLAGTLLAVCMVLDAVSGQTQVQDSTGRFEEYISPLTNKPLAVQPPLFEEYYTPDGEAYLYGNYRGPGLKLVLADSVVTLAGIPVYPTITAHKGPIKPSAEWSISKRVSDIQRIGFAKGESPNEVHDKVYNYLTHCSLVDSVSRKEFLGYMKKWPVWFKGDTFATYLAFYNSMPPPRKTYSHAQKLRHQRQLARNIFNGIKRDFQRNPPVLVFTLATGGSGTLPMTNRDEIPKIISLSPDELRDAKQNNRLPVSSMVADDLRNPLSLGDYQR